MEYALTQPLIIPIAHRAYRLERTWYYYWQLPTSGELNRLIVPKGFVCDGASVPQWLWTITGILPDGLIRAAAVAHDFIYHFEGRLPVGAHQYVDSDDRWQNVIGRWSRKATDRLFARIMREAGVDQTRRRSAYLAVRAWGWRFWKG